MEMEMEMETDDCSLPETSASYAFPCMEQPCRTVFRIGDRFLWSDKHGRVKGIHRRSSPTDQDEYVLLPGTNQQKLGSGSVWKIKSHKHGRFLHVKDQTEKDGSKTLLVCTVETEETEQQQQQQQRQQQQQQALSPTASHEARSDDDLRSLWGFHREVDTGRVMITSVFNGETLVCDELTGSVVLSPLAVDDSSGAYWNIYTVTGELGYLSCSTIDRRLRCDIMGTLNMAENWKGWEVWRFMEATNNHVRISSWMHSQFLLCCRLDEMTGQYKVTTCTFAQSYKEEATCDTEWAIFKAMDESHGIWIRSKKYGRLLSVTLDGQLSSKPSEEDDREDEIVQSSHVWQIEAAHLQKYTLTCAVIATTRSSGLVSVGPFPFVTKNLKQSDEWIMEHREQGVVAFCHYSSSSTKKEYLCVNSANMVVLEADPSFEGADLWIMEPTQGGYTFQSKWQGSYLAYEEEYETSGTLVCIPMDKEYYEETYMMPRLNLIWQINPCMPRAVSSSKIKTFAIGTSIAVGTTVAMPFAMMGVMGLLGAVGAEVGILANIVTVGLTGAEALASIGVVGATAAIIFRESSDSLDGAEDANQDDGDNEKNPISKRPFCGWRSW